MNGSNIVKDKAERFAIRIVKCSRYIRDRLHERSLADQLLRSGTSIGANLSEAEFAQSKADFITKLSISLKEAAETKFWLKLLHETDLLEDKIFYSLSTDVKEIISLLVTILRKLKDIESNENSKHRQ